MILSPMYRVRVCALLIAWSAAFLSPSPAEAKKAELWLYCHCDHTTEQGEDELVARLTIDGKQLVKIGPYDINDNGPKRKVVKKVYEQELAEGESVKIVLLLMEEDQGLPNGFLDGLTRAGTIYVQERGVNNSQILIPVIGELLKLLTANSDDVLGSIAITVTNKGGNIVTTAAPAQGQDVSAEPVMSLEFPVFPFRFTGDGSNYHVAVWQGGPRPSEPETPK